MGNIVLTFTKLGMSAAEEVETEYMGKKIVSSNYPYEKLPKNILEKLGIEDIKIKFNETKDIESLEINFLAKEVKQIKVNGIIPAWKKTHIEGIQKPGHIGYNIRNYIKEQKKVSWKQLCNYLKESGYTNPEANGSVIEALVILRDDLKEIKQIGRGKDKIYEWMAN